MDGQELIQLKADIRILEKQRGKLADEVDSLAKSKSKQLRDMDEILTQKRKELSKIEESIAEGTKKIRIINESIKERSKLIDQHAEQITVESVNKANDRLRATGALAEAVSSEGEEVSQREAELEDRTTRITQRELAADSRETVISKRESDLKTKELMLESNLKLSIKSAANASRLMTETQEKKKEIDSVMQRAKDQAEKIVSDAFSIRQDADKLKKSLDTRAKVIAGKEAQIERETARLKSQEVILLDKARTLKRAFSELRKRSK